MPIMTKAEVVAEVAERTGSTKAATERFITAYQDTIMEAVAAGNDVKMTGFVAFSPGVRAARTMRNPKTGDALHVQESRTIKIRALGVFRALIQKA